MKLYTKRQLVTSCVICAVAALALSRLLSPAPHTTHDRPQATDEAVAAQETHSNTREVVRETASEELLPIEAAGKTQSYTQDEAQNIAVYEKCNEAVVNITTKAMAYNWFYEPILTEGGSGSGSIIDKRGYVVTNVHVIENAKVINISLADGSSYEGTVVGRDTESDIAVLKFTPDAGVELKTISFGDSESLKVGQKVIAIGNPFAFERTMTTGIISALGRPIQESKNVIIRNMIQTDAAINPGNSGGPLLDSQGRMIGINTMIYSSSGSSAGVGFAIPASTARRVVSDLLKYGKVNRGTMRLSLLQNTSRIAKYAGYGISTGMVVSEVQRGSEAARAGIKGGSYAVEYGTRRNPQTAYLGGDVIVQIDNIKVAKLADYYSALEDKVPGDVVEVTVYRSGGYQKLRVVLEAQDSPSEI